MPNGERFSDGPGPDNGSVRVSQCLLDDVSLLADKYDLTEAENRRLLEASVREHVGGATPAEAIGRALASDGPLTFTLLQKDLAEHIRTARSSDYHLMALTAAQVFLRDILPKECCVNLAFAGPKSAGKSKATRIMAILSGGRFFTGGTLGALVAQFGQGSLVAIDEADALVRKLPDIEAILRMGNSWDAPYITSLPKGPGWDRVTINVGGPKVFNFRGEMEDALLSRTNVVNLPAQVDSTLVTNNFDLENPISEARDRLCRLAVRMAVGWTRMRALSHLKSPEFRARLDRLPATLARHMETAAVFLLIADILGLDLEEEIRTTTERQAESDSESDDLREYLREFYLSQPAAPSTADLEASRSVVLAYVNGKRTAQGFRPWPEKSSEFKTKLRELGFEDGKNLLRRKNGRVLVFDGDVRDRLGLDDLTTGKPPPEESFLGKTKTDALRARSEMDRAVEELGETITYPDGTVADRRTGAILWRPS